MTLSNHLEAVLLDIATDNKAPARTISNPTSGFFVTTNMRAFNDLVSMFTDVATNSHIAPIRVTVHKNIKALDTVLATNRVSNAAVRILIAGLALSTADTNVEIILTVAAMIGITTPRALTNKPPTMSVTGLNALYRVDKLDPKDLKLAMMERIAFCSSGGTKCSNIPPTPLVATRSRAFSNVWYIFLTILLRAM
ncbi:hypothetical protein D3C79_550530 [compost metagenome]